jgi:hypothetical protein
VLILPMEKDEGICILQNNVIIGLIKWIEDKDGGSFVSISSYKQIKTDIKFIKKEKISEFLFKTNEKELKKKVNVVKKSREVLGFKRKEDAE